MIFGVFQFYENNVGVFSFCREKSSYSKSRFSPKRILIFTFKSNVKISTREKHKKVDVKALKMVPNYRREEGGTLTSNESLLLQVKGDETPVEIMRTDVLLCERLFRRW